MCAQSPSISGRIGSHPQRTRPSALDRMVDVLYRWVSVVRRLVSPHLLGEAVRSVRMARVLGISIPLVLGSWGASPASAADSTLLNTGTVMWDNLNLTSGQYFAAAFTASSAGTISSATIEGHRGGGMSDGDFASTTMSFYSDRSAHPTNPANLLGVLPFDSASPASWGKVLRYSGSASIPAAGTYWMKLSVGTPGDFWVHMGTGASSVPWSAAFGTAAYDLNGAFGGSPGDVYFPSITITGSLGGGGGSGSSGGGSSSSESASATPAPVVQQFGMSGSGTCDANQPAGLDWAGVPSGGWSRSWAQWVNDGKGGAVCSRTVLFASESWTVAP